MSSLPPEGRSILQMRVARCMQARQKTVVRFLSICSVCSVFRKIEVVAPENVRELSVLTADSFLRLSKLVQGVRACFIEHPRQDAEQAFDKVFARYSTNGVIERPVLRWRSLRLEACAENEADSGCSRYISGYQVEAFVVCSRAPQTSTFLRRAAFSLGRDLMRTHQDDCSDHCASCKP